VPHVFRTPHPGRRAPHVVPLRPYPARGPGRGRGRQPQAPRAGRVHPPRRPGHLLVAAARPAGAGQDRGDSPRGDGRHRRPGGALPRTAAARALRGHRPLGGVRRRPLPPQGPQGRRLPPRAHARGDVRAPGQGPVLVVQGPAGHPLPDSDQVPRRGAPPRRPDPRSRVHHEGLVLVRRQGRGPGGQLPEAPRGVREDLPAPGPRLRHRLRDVGRDGRLSLRGVPEPVPYRRGHLRAVARRLRRQRGGRATTRPPRTSRTPPTPPPSPPSSRSRTRSSRAPTGPGPPPTP
jgi:hypothetical protein